MLKHLVTRGPATRRLPRSLLLERLGNRLCLSTWSERVIKRHLLLATLVAIVMTAFVPCAYADLYVIRFEPNSSVLRYNEVTGDFIGGFVSLSSSGVNYPVGLVFGRDSNLY